MKIVYLLSGKQKKVTQNLYLIIVTFATKFSVQFYFSIKKKWIHYLKCNYSFLRLFFPAILAFIFIQKYTTREKRRKTTADVLWLTWQKYGLNRGKQTSIHLIHAIHLPNLTHSRPHKFYVKCADSSSNSYTQFVSNTLTWLDKVSVFCRVVFIKMKSIYLIINLIIFWIMTSIAEYTDIHYVSVLHYFLRYFSLNG